LARLHHRYNGWCEPWLGWIEDVNDSGTVVGADGRDRR
jgi:hypothetical protein